MSICKESVGAIPTSFATVSVGGPEDPLEEKLKAISSAGFNAVELGFPDLVSFSCRTSHQQVEEDDYDLLCHMATQVKQLCQSFNLGILMLQPFSNFEGWPRGSKQREDAFVRATGWIRIMRALGTNMLQVGSSDSPNITANFDDLASDLRELADLLDEHGFRLAYENWCWATHAPGWRDVWEIVKKADRANIGLCLDTFQTAAGEWGDPTTPSGIIETVPLKELREKFSSSLEELARVVPAEKIYLLQISDAYKPLAPLEDSVDEQGLRPRGRWSHDFRPYPFNGGFLPVTDVAKAVLKTGFRGSFSMEVFDGGHDGLWSTKHDLKHFVEGAMTSHIRLLSECINGL